MTTATEPRAHSLALGIRWGLLIVAPFWSLAFIVFVAVTK